jgi:hypothetical protein
MALDTTTEVEELRVFTDAEGNRVPSAQVSGNFPALEGLQYQTAGTTAEALPARDVPHGATVLVTYNVANADTVFVGAEGAVGFPLAAGGDTFRADVLNLEEIHVRALSAGDSVYVMWEGVGDG